MLDRQFRQHLQAAFHGWEGRPWKTLPQHPRQVLTFIDPDGAVPYLEEWCAERYRPVAFDFETTCLKPESPQARIVSCSVSDGATTIAFPWHGRAILAMEDLLRSDVPKVASNMKFEDRWSCWAFGRWVRNWHIDTMQLAHVLDNRRKITSIKFQAFVRLGEPPWDTHVKPYLESKEAGGNAPNRIRECGLPELLVYNGMDSLMEWKVARDQCSEIGIPFLKED